MIKQDSVDVETLVESYNVVQMPEETTEHEDQEIAREIINRKRLIELSQLENEKLRVKLQSIQERFISVR